MLLGFFREQEIVAGLDSALNRWVDSVPDHRASRTSPFPVVSYISSSVRWDPDRKDDNFFNQSVSIYATYYYIQIVVHRQFIPSPNKPSPLTFPSLAISTNAARSCCSVIDTQRRRNSGSNPPPFIQLPAFAAGTALLLNMWGQKRAGLSTSPQADKDKTMLHVCKEVLTKSKAWWFQCAIPIYVNACFCFLLIYFSLEKSCAHSPVRESCHHCGQFHIR